MVNWLIDWFVGWVGASVNQRTSTNVSTYHSMAQRSKASKVRHGQVPRVVQYAVKVRRAYIAGNQTQSQRHSRQKQWKRRTTHEQAVKRQKNTQKKTATDKGNSRSKHSRCIEDYTRTEFTQRGGQVCPSYHSIEGRRGGGRCANG